MAALTASDDAADLLSLLLLLLILLLEFGCKTNSCWLSNIINTLRRHCVDARTTAGELADDDGDDAYKLQCDRIVRNLLMFVLLCTTSASMDRTRAIITLSESDDCQLALAFAFALALDLDAALKLPLLLLLSEASLSFFDSFFCDFMAAIAWSNDVAIDTPLSELLEGC
jgi:hypothetical protein